ncbi:endo-1,4-beta-xylanase [Aetokthonos hydrillicola Thurmond2011]|jgi:endo-1,4-beta-xylanase|uniref:Beta-xylanase n=1 Tax=Aetokthonos hydrillicola Thurmond2011 TaxID=2712845 RepID=A0AAP5IAU7_9CYAN|nr:endo-1,4-beta-xylanase [Aetokthonos hydrillicola]MBO3460955.1 endo-1,4-beta-xylanase [Aetokthonos hydrillicola CCALA 1050]MBW4583627.1 endo-1,4-beta-xylanase [Aetokthonos hydrillicola CCALA 1050]MDR9895680.1 endo-1,4-beta-xylanase [Aetokthonos hydrillicola Thurmond2011]
MLKNQKLFRRRNFLLTLGALTSTVTFAKVKGFKDYNTQDNSNKTKKNFSVVGNSSLSRRAAVKGIIYGAYPEGGYKTLSENKPLQSIFSRECGLVVAGFFAGVRPSISTFDFTEADYLSQFTSSRGILFQGTPLVWWKEHPKWLEDKFNDPRTQWKEIQNILINHVSTIVRRYAGRTHSWVVVNEAVELKGERSDGLSLSPWLQKLGPGYIDLAFRVAAQSDPKAMLIYNDGGLEYPEHELRRKAVLKLLQRLKSRGVPIHAFGIQSHLSPYHKNIFEPKKFRKFLADVADLGLKIMISELDVIDNILPVDTVDRDRIVADIYEDYLSVALTEKAVVGVITWGLSDRYTWLSSFAPRSDKAPVRPLPFDLNFKPKLAWNAIARSFDQAPKR